MKNSRPAAGDRQPMETDVNELGALFEQTHGDEEISIEKKGRRSGDTALVGYK